MKKNWIIKLCTFAPYEINTMDVKKLSVTYSPGHINKGQTTQKKLYANDKVETQCLKPDPTEDMTPCVTKNPFQRAGHG